MVIAAVEVTTVGSDAGQITPLDDQIHDCHGIFPKEALVASGFVNLEPISVGQRLAYIPGLCPAY